MVQFLGIISVLILVVLPSYLLIRLSRKKNTNPIGFIIQWVLVAVLVLFFYQGASWPFAVGYYTRYLMLGMLILCSSVILFRYKRITKTRATWKNYLFSVLNILVILILINGMWMIKKGKHPSEKKIELAFPLRGERYYVAHGGSTEIINHHFAVPSQKFALDICKLTPIGLRAHSLFPKDLSSYAIFGQNLYSPCSGTIIEVADQYPDQRPPLSDPEHPFGNFLAIRTLGGNAVIVLAHLQKGSLQKQVGDQIQKGELVGKVGNSGNTSEPHLHIHAVDGSSTDYLYDGEGISITFDGAFYVRNDLINKSH